MLGLQLCILGRHATFLQTGGETMSTEMKRWIRITETLIVLSQALLVAYAVHLRVTGVIG